MSLARIMPGFVLFGLLIGCAAPAQRTDSFPRKSERDRVWNAMNTVLSRHFQVRTDRYMGSESSWNYTYSGNAVIGVGKMHSDGFQKYRLKVVGRVYLDDEDFYQAHIRVIKQIDVSMAHTMARATAQPRYRWRNVGFHDAMETQLANEVDKELRGRANPYSGRFFRNELPKTQKKAKGKTDF